MRLKTVWTIPSMSTIERLRRTLEWATMETAHRLPKSIKYWVTMQEIARVTYDKPDILATSVDEILRRLDK